MTNLLGLPKELCWVRYKLQAEARLAKKKKMASICHAITAPPVTKIRLWASFGV